MLLKYIKINTEEKIQLAWLFSEVYENYNLNIILTSEGLKYKKK